MAHGESIRFHVIFPADLYDSLKALADEEGGRSVASLLREVSEDRIRQVEAARV